MGGSYRAGGQGRELSADGRARLHHMVANVWRETGPVWCGMAGVQPGPDLFFTTLGDRKWPKTGLGDPKVTSKSDKKWRGGGDRYRYIGDYVSWGKGAGGWVLSGVHTPFSHKVWWFWGDQRFFLGRGGKEG